MGCTIEDLRDKPWLTAQARIDPEIYEVHGMLGPEERAALFWIGREYCCGSGCIVDAGAFLGSCAYSIASGLERSTNPSARASTIYSYDLFETNEQYVIDCIQCKFPKYEPGSSFFDIYAKQIEKYRQRITPVVGDFTQSAPLSRPIEVLFVDLDKSPELHHKFLIEFYPHLVPERALLLHQDWYLSRHPWIHFGMEYLAEYFTLVDPLVLWCTRIFLLNRPIPSERLNILANGALGYDQELYLLDRLIERENGAMRCMLRLSKATHAWVNGYVDAARKIVTSVEADLDGPDNSLLSEFRYLKLALRA